MTASAASIFVSMYSNASRVPADFSAIAEDETHVWRFRFADATPNAEDEISRWLPEDEASASRQFIFRELTTRYVLRRGFVRCVLSRYAKIEPRAIAFELTKRGKPSLTSNAFAFSISHTKDEALLAVTKRAPLGVDVERIKADIDPRSMGRIVLAKDEALDLASLEGDELKRRFLRVWCRKEACLKATAAGLLDNLTTLSVIPDTVDIGACTDDRIEPEHRGIVHVQDLYLDDEHAGALAVTDVRAPVAGVPLIPRFEVVVPSA